MKLKRLPPKKIVVTGLRHQDDYRKIQLIKLPGGKIGCIMQFKDLKPVKFSLSSEGSRILSSMLTKAVRGKFKKYTEKQEYHWVVVDSVEQK